MGAGWLYYHKYPPKRKCPECGKRHFLKRIAVASNGEDLWAFGNCPNAKKKIESGKIVMPNYQT
jgi:hypothetical protein